MEPFSDLEEAFAQEVKSAYSLLDASLAEADFDLQRIVQEGNWFAVLHQLKMFSESNTFADALQKHIAQADEIKRRHERLRWEVVMMRMSENEKQLIGECLVAAAHGPFFPDWEFSILFGLQRGKVVEIASAWPIVNSVDVEGGTVDQAINNAFVWLLWYPHKLMERWAEYISVPPRECYDLYNRWRQLTGRKNHRSAGKAEFFYNLQ